MLQIFFYYGKFPFVAVDLLDKEAVQRLNKLQNFRLQYLVDVETGIVYIKSDLLDLFQGQTAILHKSFRIHLNCDTIHHILGLTCHKGYRFVVPLSHQEEYGVTENLTNYTVAELEEMYDAYCEQQWQQEPPFITYWD